LEQLTTEDLAGGEKFIVKTVYGPEYVVEKRGITIIDSSKKLSESFHEADEVKISLCRVGSWLKAILCRNGVEEFFLSNCIMVVSIEPV